MTNRFIFPEELDSDAKLDLVSAEYFNWENSIISEFALAADISDENATTKTDILKKLNNRLGDDQYSEFAEDFYKKYGKPANDFNFQLYSVDDSLSINAIRESADKYHKTALELEYELFSNKVILKNSTFSESDGSLIFSVSDTPETRDTDEWEVVDRGQVSNLDESMEASEEAYLRSPTSYHVETRIYPDKQIVAVSNSDVANDLQESIIGLIEMWGSSDE